MKVKIRLEEKHVRFLRNLPEQGMGYQIVNITLNDGSILKHRVVFNSMYLEADENEKIDPKRIATMRIAS